MLFKSQDKRGADHTCRWSFDVSISQKKNALKIAKGTEPLISGLLILPCYCVLLFAKKSISQLLSGNWGYPKVKANGRADHIWWRSFDVSISQKKNPLQNEP